MMNKATPSTNNPNGIISSEINRGFINKREKAVEAIPRGPPKSIVVPRNVDTSLIRSPRTFV